METVNSTLRDSQASGVGPSSQLERGGTQGSQGIDEQILVGLQQSQSTHADSVGKETVTLQPPEICQSLRKEMMELHQQVTEDPMHIKHGIPFSQDIMIEELPAQFWLPSHLPTYDCTTNPAKRISKFYNAALLHRYTISFKCHVFVTTLTNSAQQWSGQLPAGSIRSFIEFSSLFWY
ncbi:UNVERIFIED_CONTAM: hypothetical protein Sradi_6110500 [Sesamum radiatum]|uniref:Uncharacterized protein n=1 Tax=Sesamum radiatum TaxID=300843 RepID=A0AAW2KIW2_SESRA